MGGSPFPPPEPAASVCCAWTSSNTSRRAASALLVWPCSGSNNGAYAAFTHTVFDRAGSFGLRITGRRTPPSRSPSSTRSCPGRRIINFPRNRSSGIPARTPRDGGSMTPEPPPLANVWTTGLPRAHSRPANTDTHNGSVQKQRSEPKACRRNYER